MVPAAARQSSRHSSSFERSSQRSPRSGRAPVLLVFEAVFADQALEISALDLGFVSSFSGIVTFKNAVAVQEAARSQPGDAILVETDAPYLAPVPFRGKRNEPAHVVHTARALAAMRGEEEEDFAARVTRNAREFYRLGTLGR